MGRGEPEAERSGSSGEDSGHRCGEEGDEGDGGDGASENSINAFIYFLLNSNVSGCFEVCLERSSDECRR